MTAKQDAFALVSYFEKAYKEKYGYKVIVNKYSARWGFDTILTQMSKDDAQELIDYYFTTASSNSHDLEWFFYHYHELIKAKVGYDEDAAFRARAREETAKRVEEWRAKRGNRTKGN